MAPDLATGVDMATEEIHLEEVQGEEELWVAAMVQEEVLPEVEVDMALGWVQAQVMVILVVQGEVLVAVMAEEAGLEEEVLIKLQIKIKMNELTT